MMRIIACLKFDTSFGKKKRGLFLLCWGGGDKKQGAPLKIHLHPLFLLRWSGLRFSPMVCLYLSAFMPFIDMRLVPGAEPGSRQRALSLFACRVRADDSGGLWRLNHHKSTPDCQIGLEWEEVQTAHFRQSIIFWKCWNHSSEPLFPPNNMSGHEVPSTTCNSRNNVGPSNCKPRMNNNTHFVDCAQSENKHDKSDLQTSRFHFYPLFLGLVYWDAEAGNLNYKDGSELLLTWPSVNHNMFLSRPCVLKITVVLMFFRELLLL